MTASARLAVLLVTLLATACREDAEPLAPDASAARYPRAGLFTPGNLIGAKPYDAGRLDAGPRVGGLSEAELREIEDSIARGDSEERCVMLQGGGTPGTLEVSFTTASYGGHYDPENCGAVWIEDAEGRYVKTPMIWAQLRIRNLFIWDALRCQLDRPDVISSATLPDHTELHEATWDGTDYRGNVVADGTYVLNIEVTEDEFNYGRRAEYPFEKGMTPLTLEPDDETSVKGLKLTYTPAP